MAINDDSRAFTEGNDGDPWPIFFFRRIETNLGRVYHMTSPLHNGG